MVYCFSCGAELNAKGQPCDGSCENCLGVEMPALRMLEGSGRQSPGERPILTLIRSLPRPPEHPPFVAA
jgi:hypothetical protein